MDPTNFNLTSQLSDDEGYEEDMYLFIYFTSYIPPVYIGRALLLWACNMNFVCQKKKKNNIYFFLLFELLLSCWNFSTQWLFI